MFWRFESNSQPLGFSWGGFKQHYLEKFLADHGFRSVYATQRAEGSDEDGLRDFQMGTGVEDGLADAAIIQLIFAETNLFIHFFDMVSYMGQCAHINW